MTQRTWSFLLGFKRLVIYNEMPSDPGFSLATSRLNVYREIHKKIYYFPLRLAHSIREKIFILAISHFLTIFAFI